MLRKLGSLLRGRRRLQPVFEALHRVALAGMNYGGTGSIRDSGELSVLRYVREKMRKADRPLIIVDVGANEGEYTEHVMRVFGDRARVLAFEPSQRPFQALSRRLVSFPQVSLYNIGLGDSNVVVPLYEVDGQSGLSSLYDRRLSHLNLEMKTRENVQIRKLEEVCLEEGVNRIDLLKLDVEGHELGVLRGAKRLLDTGAVEFIQFEFGGCNVDSRTYFRDLYYFLSEKYCIARVLANGLYPIPRYSETQEVFITTNYLAERKR